MWSVVHLDASRTWRGGQLQVYLLHREFLRMGLDSRLLARAGGALHLRCKETGLSVEPVPVMRACYPSAIVAVWHETRHAAIVHAHDSHAAGLAAIARLANPHLSVVCHRRVAYPLRGMPNASWKYRHIDRWIAVSNEIGGKLRRAGVPDPFVVHSAVDIDSLRDRAPSGATNDLRASLGIRSAAPVIGIFGALTAQKGHEDLIDAAPRILESNPDVVFLCVGEGRLAGRLRRRVRRAGLQANFRWTGFRRDVSTLMELCSVIAVPSRDGEGSNAVLKEAVVLGIPVVASDLPGNTEVLGDGGVYVAAADHRALAAALIGALADSGGGKEEGVHSVPRSRDWAPEVMAASMLAAYEGVGRSVLASSEAI